MSDDLIDISRPPKKKGGLFVKGCSGNPAGKPPGTPNKTTRLRQQLLDCLPQLLESLKQQALAGEVTAIKLLLERTMPPVKAAYPTVTLPVESDSLVEYGKATLHAVAQGTIAPDVATTVLQGLAAQAKLIETQDLTDRIAALESLLRQRGEQP